jgi:hypothetical protein
VKTNNGTKILIVGLTQVEEGVSAQVEYNFCTHDENFRTCRRCFDQDDIRKSACLPRNAQCCDACTKHTRLRTWLSFREESHETAFQLALGFAKGLVGLKNLRRVSLRGQ